MEDKKLVLFDFDGTIADSLPLMVETFRDLSRHHKHIHPLLDIANTDKPLLEHPTVIILRRQGLKAAIKSLKLSRIQVAFIYIRAMRRFSQRIKQLKPVPGMPVALQELSGTYEIGIVTSNSEANVRYFLNQHDIQNIAVVKSQPNLFGKSATISKVIHSLGYPLHNVVYVGDEVRDIEAAQRAGIASVAVSWGLNDHDLLAWHDPSALIDSPSQLVGAVHKVLN